MATIHDHPRSYQLKRHFAAGRGEPACRGCRLHACPGPNVDVRARLTPWPQAYTRGVPRKSITMKLKSIVKRLLDGVGQERQYCSAPWGERVLQAVR